jgi:hypothetical protein
MTRSSDTLLYGVISLLLGIISVAVWDFYAILGIIAIVLGLTAIKGAMLAKVLGIVGIILGIITLVRLLMTLVH